MKHWASMLAGGAVLALGSLPTSSAAGHRFGSAAAATVQAAAPRFNACCPPWNSTQLQSVLVYQPTGAIGAPYRIQVVPTAQVNTQLNAYVTYLQSLGMGFTQMLVTFQLIDAGTGATPASGVQISLQGLNWTGTGSPTANFFTNNLSPNHWYRVESRIILAGGPEGFLPRECWLSYVNFRWQVLPGARSSAARGVLQFRLEDGRTIERPATR